MSKMSLEEATLKALYDELDDSRDITDVDGLVEDVLVITDPEVSSEEYEEIIERAQEIVEDTPEGNIPLDEDYLGQYAQTCPLCGATFVTEEILEPGATCPICLEVPEAFVMVGRLEGDEAVAEKNGLLDNEEGEEESFGEENNIIPTSERTEDDIDVDEFEDNDEDIERLEKELASKEIPQGNILTESINVGDTFKNHMGAVIVVTEPDNEGRPCWYVYNPETKVKGEVLSTDSYETFEKVLSDNGYEKAEVIIEEAKEIVEETVTEETVEDIHTRIENAESIEEIQDIIYTIEDNDLETEAMLAYQQCLEDGDDLEAVKDFVIVTIEDNAKYEYKADVELDAKKTAKFLEEEKLVKFSVNGEEKVSYTAEDEFEGEREATVELVAQENGVSEDEVQVEVVEESLEKKEELFIPDYEHVQEWSDEQVAKWIIDNFREITHRDLEDVYNRPVEEDEETPLFKDEVIDETAPAIDEMISKLGFTGNRRDEILYALDDCLVAHRNDNPAPIFNEEEKVEEDKSALEKSMDALDEIEALANGDGELLKLGQEMGLTDFKKYLQDKGLLKEAITIEELEGNASLEDIADLEAAGDALNKIWDAIVGGETDFLNTNYRDEISSICDQLDAILQAAKDSRKDIEE